VAEREIARRNQLAQQAAELIQQGNQAREKKDLAMAVDAYGKAYRRLPDAPVYRDLRQQARRAFSEVSVDRAEELATQGHYAEANATLDPVLAVEVNPEYVPALRLKEQIQDPERYNPALSPAHVQRVQRVTELLTVANGHYDLGEFDKAREAFNEVLAIDAYNTAARRGLERVERTISQYLSAARDHTRSEAMRKIDEQWADAVPPALSGTGLLRPGADRGGSPNFPSMREKAKAIILPQVQMIDAALDEVVQYLTLQAKNFDTFESDPARKGINLVIGSEPGLAKKSISLSLTNVPLAYVLETTARQAGTHVEYGDSIVTIGSTGGAELITRSYRAPPGFFSQQPTNATSAPSNPFSTEKPAGGTLGFARISAPEFLRQNGITFPEGAAAYYSPASSTLTVRNTVPNHELVQALIDQASTNIQKQVKLKVTMLEVNQDNLNELGFDSLLGAFDLGNGRVFGSGGTAGNTPGADTRSFAGNFPLVPPGPNSVPVGANPVTAGNRSGNSATPANSIETLLRGTNRSPDASIRAPAVFGLAGVFTDPQFQIAMRGLNQKKGIDIMSTPVIVAKSGQRAKVQVIREFPYPTEFEPPEIPQSFGTNQSTFTLFQNGVPIFNSNSANSSGGFPVTPTTPTAFEKKNVGHELEIEATVGPDNQTIDLDVTPAFREFEGMINYGTPILIYPDGVTPQVLTENRIPQPVFRTNRTEGIKFSLWSGSTMVIAGMAGEETITVDDKTPILGDLPVVGRFFRSHVTKVKQKAVVFMVTAQVIDPSGEVPAIGTIAVKN
jgi:general secretion pathway protein D